MKGIQLMDYNKDYMMEKDYYLIALAEQFYLMTKIFL
jgi:hypothetical protein